MMAMGVARVKRKPKPFCYCLLVRKMVLGFPFGCKRAQKGAKRRRKAQRDAGVDAESLKRP